MRMLLASSGEALASISLKAVWAFSYLPVCMSLTALS